MPKMGESITEATIISWLKSVGDYVEADETIIEVATDKVDNDVPSPVSGIITEIHFQKDDVVEVGTVLALIDSSQVSDGSQQILTKVENSQEISKKAEVISNTKPETHNPKPATRNPQPKTRNPQP